LDAILSADPKRAHEAMRNHVAASSLNVIDYVMATRTGSGEQTVSAAETATTAKD
jgi:DNA-binding FadR family transcriptional regulator